MTSHKPQRVNRQDSPRWCGKCRSYGDHHTDRCYKIVGSEETAAPEGDS